MSPAATLSRRHHALADALRRAREQRTPIEPLTEHEPTLSVADAYAIAQVGVAADIATGARVVGHKIGLTSIAVQQQLGVSEPDYGALLDTMAIVPGGSIESARLIAPRIELELAFRLNADLRGPGVTRDDVRAATETVHPAIEVVDSRIVDWRITLADTIADNASSAAFVIAERGVALDDLDAAAIEVELHRNGELIDTGRSDAVLGDPCEAVAWLANAVGRLGDALPAGEMVLSGACTRMTDIAPGERYRAVFHGLDDLEVEVVR